MPFSKTAKFIAAIAIWTLVALVFASQSYFYGIVTGEDKDWTRVFWWTFSDWYIWAALSPAIFWLVRHCSFSTEQWIRALGIHIIAALVFSIVHLIIQTLVQHLTGWSKFAGGEQFATAFMFLFVKKFHLNLLTYAALAGIGSAAQIYRDKRRRESDAHRLAEEKLRLEAELTGAQLSALQMQLNPHFLFNALNTLSEMIHLNPQSADKMVVRLGELLRISLEREQQAETSLEKELKFLRKYLEIEQFRFFDRLNINYRIDTDALPACVPSLILQPLAENAVKHGVTRLPGTGVIDIIAERAGEKLKLVVRDNGAGLPDDWNISEQPQRERIGLSNTRARLRKLYDGSSSFEIKPVLSGGTEVSIIIPFREMCDGK